jgi:uncharacterized tellurite resistance protein B-like protein
MLKQIKTFFEQNLLAGPTESTDASEHRLRLAVAALLLEMTRMDDEIHDEERQRVEQGVREQFELTADETAALIELAEAERHDATDYFQFTSLINEGYGAEQKAALIDHLWRIAYADKVLHRYEEHLVRKISELLYVPHSVYIAAKHRHEGGATAE